MGRCAGTHSSPFVMNFRLSFPLAKYFPFGNVKKVFAHSIRYLQLARLTFGTSQKYFDPIVIEDNHKFFTRSLINFPGCEIPNCVPAGSPLVKNATGKSVKITSLVIICQNYKLVIFVAVDMLKRSQSLACSGHSYKQFTINNKLIIFESRVVIWAIVQSHNLLSQSLDKIGRRSLVPTPFAWVGLRQALKSFQVFFQVKNTSEFSFALPVPHLNIFADT